MPNKQVKWILLLLYITPVYMSPKMNKLRHWVLFNLEHLWEWKHYRKFSSPLDIPLKSSFPSPHQRIVYAVHDVTFYHNTFYRAVCVYIFKFTELVSYHTSCCAVSFFFFYPILWVWDVYWLMSVILSLPNILTHEYYMICLLVNTWMDN